MRTPGMNAAGLRRLIYCLPLIFFCVICCSKYSWEGGRYYDKSNKISLQFPAGWDLSKKEGEVTYFKNFENTAFISILTGKMPSHTLDEFVDAAINQGTNLHGGKFKESEKVELTVDGTRACRFTSRKVDEANGQFSFVSYFLLKNGIAFKITIIAKSDYFEANEKKLLTIAEGLRFES